MTRHYCREIRLRPLVALGLTLVVVASSCGDDSSGSLEAAIDQATSDDAESGSSGAGDATDDAEPPPSDDGGDGAEDGDNTTDPDDKGDVDGDAKDGAAVLSRTFDDSVSAAAEACMIAGLLDDPDLLEMIVGLAPGADLDDLDPSSQVAAVDLGLSCVTEEEFAAAFADDDGFFSGEVANEVSGCLYAELTDASDDSRAQTLLALVAVGNDQAPTGDQQPLLVALLTTCVSGDVMNGVVASAFLDDPTLASAADRECISETSSSTEYAESLWSAFAAMPGAEFEALPPDVQLSIIGPLVGCVSFGQVIANESPIPLSPGTISCIDAAIGGEELLGLVFSDSGTAESLGLAVVQCLTPEEVEAIGGT